MAAAREDRILLLLAVATEAAGLVTGVAAAVMAHTTVLGTMQAAAQAATQATAATRLTRNQTAQQHLRAEAAALADTTAARMVNPVVAAWVSLAKVPVAQPLAMVIQAAMVVLVAATALLENPTAAPARAT
jgi:hypothetical protein